MSEGLLEHKWSTVRLGANSGHVEAAGSTSSGGLSWYNNYVSLEGDRRAVLSKYDMMDRRSVEVSRSLDIIAEDLSSANADDEPMLRLDFDDDSKIRKTHIKALNYLMETWSDRNNFETSLFDHGRELFKYGAVFFLKKPDGTLKRISPEKLVGYVLSPDDENIVTHYLIDWDAPFLNIKESHKKVEKINNQNKQRQIDHISVEDMVIIKRGQTPFGESLLERAYPIWRKIDLLETAVVIHRFTRSVDRRVYYIDVGRLPPKKHKEVIDKYRLQMRQKRVMSKDGGVDSEFDPHSMTEDYFLPVTSQGRSSRIESLQGSPSSGELSDLTYLARKLAAAMRVPPSMTDTQNEGNDRDTYSDMRVGQVYQVEMRYLGFVNRDKRKVEKALEEHFNWFCKEREVEVPEEMCLKINESHNFALYKNIETYQSLLNLFQSTMQATTISKQFALSKYLNLSKEELVDNEVMILTEKGITDEQIKEMTAEEIANIVYGDGRLGEKFGLAAAEDGGFGRGF